MSADYSCDRIIFISDPGKILIKILFFFHSCLSYGNVGKTNYYVYTLNTAVFFSYVKHLFVTT